MRFLNVTDGAHGVTKDVSIVVNGRAQQRRSLKSMQSVLASIEISARTVGALTECAPTKSIIVVMLSRALATVLAMLTHRQTLT